VITTKVLNVNAQKCYTNCIQKQATETCAVLPHLLRSKILMKLKS